MKGTGPRLWPGLPHRDEGLDLGLLIPFWAGDSQVLWQKPRLVSPSLLSPQLAMSLEVMFLHDLS